MEEQPREPDPRFTLANERTFLAWIRTSLALIAGGIALAEFGERIGPSPIRQAMSVAPVMAGTALSLLSYLHWRSCQRALRTGEPLPPPRFAIGLTALVVAAGLVLSISLLLRH
ncbi:YidH family protein [Actinomadura scrupuli]|uniref:YidH family protein n=1 Tax=Actinomadura scrupuli TaxID=559629 RepID=UPI003D97D4F2